MKVRTGPKVDCDRTARPEAPDGANRSTVLASVVHGKTMSLNDEYSALKTTVKYKDVLWSYESAKGKPGWPPEDQLKGKKEFVLLGASVSNIEVDHRSPTSRGRG